MPDYDLQATANARDAIEGTRVQAECGTCHKTIYREPPFPGVASEWKHRSSGATISWNPSKHLASRTATYQHQHRFEAFKKKGFLRCAILGCEAETPIDDKVARMEAVAERRKGAQSVKDAAVQESRERGGEKGRVTQQRKSAIPY